MSPGPRSFQEQLAGNYTSPLIDKVGKSSIDWMPAKQPASNWSTVPPLQHPLPVQRRHLEEEVKVKDKEGGKKKGQRGAEEGAGEGGTGKRKTRSRGERGAKQKEEQHRRSRRKKIGKRS